MQIMAHFFYLIYSFGSGISHIATHLVVLVLVVAVLIGATMFKKS